MQETTEIRRSNYLRKIDSAVEPPIPSVTLVTTLGARSMDKYSQKLAEQLSVPKIRTDIYQQIAESFNSPLLSPAAVRSLLADARFVRTLRRAGTALHLTNQHLGRYGRLLSTPYLITVHDLIRYFDHNGRGDFIQRPNRRDRSYLSLDYAGIKKAATVIAVSETTKRDLVRHLAIPEERIFVVYEGVDHALFRPVEGLRLEWPYLLFVGSEQPRKNLPTLLKALKRLKREPRFRDLKLVKVGKPGSGDAPFRRRTLAAVSELGLERDVVFTEYVPDEELVAFYSGAECFVLPSFYEGFGFPPLEAMACGCPAIVSSAGALPEVAGDAALVVDPNDERALAASVREVLSDEGTRTELSRRGLARAAAFSWQRAAAETLEVYARFAPPT